MGDMADYAIDMALDQMARTEGYRSGNMSIEEAIDAGIVDEQGHEMSPYSGTITTRTCRCCGKERLRWVLMEGKWRLYEGERLHDCKVNPLRKDGE